MDRGNTYSGRGIQAKGGELRLRDCEISRCNACGDGGAIAMEYGAQLQAWSCVIRDNRASGSGGGIDLRSGTAHLFNCIVSGNSSYYEGGGIDCSPGGLLYSEARIIAGNASGWDGGGISNWSDQRTTWLKNCTVLGNTGAWEGGGIWSLVPVGAVDVINCIIRDNVPDQISGVDFEARYCNILGGYAGEGNIDADPIFVSAGGFDHLLGPNSPCIDAGDPAVEDQIYDWLPQWPYSNGPRSDMGAYGGASNRGWLPARAWSRRAWDSMGEAED